MTKMKTKNLIENNYSIVGNEIYNSITHDKVADFVSCYSDIRTVLLDACKIGEGKTIINLNGSKKNYKIGVDKLFVGTIIKYVVENVFENRPFTIGQLRETCNQFMSPELFYCKDYKGHCPFAYWIFEEKYLNWGLDMTLLVFNHRPPYGHPDYTGYCDNGGRYFHNTKSLIKFSELKEKDYLYYDSRTHEIIKGAMGDSLIRQNSYGYRHPITKEQAIALLLGTKCTDKTGLDLTKGKITFSISPNKEELERPTYGLLCELGII